MSRFALVVAAMALVATLAAPVAQTPPFSALMITQTGRDAPFTIAGGCDRDTTGVLSPDRYMDAGEKVTYTMQLLAPPGGPVFRNVRLRPVLVDANSPANCPCSVAGCIDPPRADNDPLPPGTLAITPPAFFPVTVPASPLPPLIVGFSIAVDAGVVGPQKIELVLETDQGECIHAARHVLDVDERSLHYSTDYPVGGMDVIVYDYNNDEVAQDPDPAGRFETKSYESMTVGKDAGGILVARNQHLLSPWNFDGNDGGFANGLAGVTSLGLDVNRIHNWGEDKNFNGIEDGVCVADPATRCFLFGVGTDPRCAHLPDTTCQSMEDNGPPGAFVRNWNTKGGCGWQTRSPSTCSDDDTRGCFHSDDCLGFCSIESNPVNSTFEACFNDGGCSLLLQCEVLSLPWNGAPCGSCDTSGTRCATDDDCPLAESCSPDDARCGGQFGSCLWFAQECLEAAGTCDGPMGEGGVWHTGEIGGTLGPCDDSVNGQCRDYGVPTTSGSPLNWFELLLTPVVEKVDQTVDADGDPVARVEVLDWAWNQSLDLTDSFATVTWEFDNDVDHLGSVDLIGDLAVLGSITGPQGAVSGTAFPPPPPGVGYPLFAPMARCTGGRVCITTADCPATETCVWQGYSANGTVPRDRDGQNNCFFEGRRTIPVPNQPQIHLAGPPDDDDDNDGDDMVDEHVWPNGPIRNMDITKAGGPNLTLDMLEDLIGDAGNRFQGAIGFLVQQGTVPNLPEPGYGLAIDDMVLAWREYDLVPDQGRCDAGEVDLMTAARNVSGTVDIHYTPACESVGNSIVWGLMSALPLGLPAAYSPTVSGPDDYCDIGNIPPYLGFDPPTTGSYFFIVVANDGAATEGAYGVGNNGLERPANPFNLTQCGYSKFIALRCD